MRVMLGLPTVDCGSTNAGPALESDSVRCRPCRLRDIACVLAVAAAINSAGEAGQHRLEADRLQKHGYSTARRDKTTCPATAPARKPAHPRARRREMTDAACAVARTGIFTTRTGRQAKRAAFSHGPGAENAGQNTGQGGMTNEQPRFEEGSSPDNRRISSRHLRRCGLGTAIEATVRRSHARGAGNNHDNIMIIRRSHQSLEGRKPPCLTIARRLLVQPGPF